jgi:hypothetical protein
MFLFIAHISPVDVLQETHQPIRYLLPRKEELIANYLIKKKIQNHMLIKKNTVLIITITTKLIIIIIIIMIIIIMIMIIIIIIMILLIIIIIIIIIVIIIILIIIILRLAFSLSNQYLNQYQNGNNLP